MSTGFTLVEEPLIEYIIDQEDGREYKSEEYISPTDRDIAYIRMRVFDAMRRGEPNIICAACHSPAYPRKNFNTRKFHFVHVSINSSKECPYNEKSKRFNTERIDSMRYNGQKEGPDHKYLKKLLRVLALTRISGLTPVKPVKKKIGMALRMIRNGVGLIFRQLVNLVMEVV